MRSSSAPRPTAGNQSSKVYGWLDRDVVPAAAAATEIWYPQFSSNRDLTFVGNLTRERPIRGITSRLASLKKSKHPGLVIPLIGRSRVRFPTLVRSLIAGFCGHPARPSEHAVRPPLRPRRPLTTVRGRLGWSAPASRRRSHDEPVPAKSVSQRSSKAQ